MPTLTIKKVLIANRGEIACRVIRACRALGLSTVAVYSDADADALHVQQADERVHIGPSRSTQSYLLTDHILEAARQTGADAIHPGYGFLSENAAFATAVIDRGLVWVGPAPQSIREMGDKKNARHLAQRAGVPVVPGTDEIDTTDPDTLLQRAAEVGYPLLVKAAAGGGGIGMRQVQDASQLVAAVESTRSQALSAFGSGEVFLERYIPRARHVEVQLFGLGARAVHLYERDCSIQRRFQKIIEETPAPGLSDDVRHAMHQAAVALAEAVSYEGAGTVEFIVDADTHAFYFLEMNTRIQVEHAITEMTTDVDLVAMQLQYAGGALPPLSQDMIQQRGHAIECRLYAENPAKHFMPSPGTLHTLSFPDADPARTRIETGYASGDTITPFYDPMISKIVAYGDDRTACMAHMLDVLAQTRVEGIATNLSFLSTCLRHPTVQAGEATTSFVANHLKELTA